MGFLERIKKIVDEFRAPVKQDEAPPESVSIEYAKVRGFIDSKSEPVFDEVEARVSETVDALSRLKAGLESDVSELMDAKLSSMNDRRLERAIHNNRKALLSKLNTFCKGLQVSKTGAAESFEFFDDAREKTHMLMADTSKNFYFVNTGFQSVSESIKADLLEIGKKTEEALGYLKPVKWKLDAVKGAYEMLDEIDAGLQTAGALDDEVSVAKKRIAELEKSSSVLEKEIHDLESAEGSREAARLFREHETVVSGIDGARGRIVQLMSPIGRALKKYSRVAQLSGRREEELLGRYAENPSRALEEDEGLELLRAVLTELEAHVSRGSIGLKDKLRAKTLGAIADLKDGAELSRLRSELLLLVEKEAKVSRLLESDATLARKKELSEKRSKAVASVKSLEDEISEKVKASGVARRDAEGKVLLLEKKLGKVFGCRVKIRLKSSQIRGIPSSRRTM